MYNTIYSFGTAKGENFDPSYLRLNPHGMWGSAYRSRNNRTQLSDNAGTVPTLVVPLEKTLSPEIESRYKAIQDTRVSAESILGAQYIPTMFRRSSSSWTNPALRSLGRIPRLPPHRRPSHLLPSRLARSQIKLSSCCTALQPIPMRSST